MPLKDPQKRKEYNKQWRDNHKEYVRIKNKEYREKHRDEMNAASRKINKKNRDERRKILIERLGGKCVKCGTTENLQFDHIDPNTKKDRTYCCLLYTSPSPRDRG